MLWFSCATFMSIANNKEKHMNIQRLQTLAAFLRTVSQEHFDLRSWRSSVGCEYASDEDLTTLQCGTTACAVGWACSMPEFQAQGLTWGTDGISPAGYPVYAPTETKECSASWEAVEEFFDISYNTAEHLFASDKYAENATAVQVADRIEEVIAR